jgi:diguanylate cyclase (GGDEF)-like protein
MAITQPQQILATSINPALLHHDPLTGLPDRFGLSDVLAQVLHQSLTQQSQAAYFVIGIDHMQRINQQYGLAVGHDVLRAVARTLDQIFDEPHYLCWLGGDTFGLVIHDLDQRSIDTLGTVLLELFRAQPICPQIASPVLVSVGGVAIPGTFKLVSDIVNGAELALRNAKEQGRNRFHSCDAKQITPTYDAARLACLVRESLAHDKIMLAWQPVVENASGRVLFYEALARLQGDDGQPIPAVTFIPVVEQLSLSFAFDSKVLALAVNELRQHPALQLAINVSGYTASQPQWTNVVTKALEGRRDLASRLIIEITETAEILDLEHACNFIAANNNLGGRIALDDFGAGYTSLKQLRTLAVQIMKIDRALITDLLENNEQQVVVRALISLARGLGLHVVAEGVEDQQVADWLSAHKVDSQQGYHHGRPQMERPWAQLGA